MERTVQADPDAVWRAWKPSFPMRPRKEEARNLHVYPLAYGIKVPVTLVGLNEGHNWTLEHRLPAGKLVIDHWMASGPDGKLRVGQTYEVLGPMSIVYRLLAPGIRSSARAALADLARRSEGRGGV